MIKQIVSIVIVLTFFVGNAYSKSNWANDSILCKAGISVLNGRSIDSMLSTKNNAFIQISYIRTSDGKQFDYVCRTETNQIRWKINPTEWNKTQKIFFRVDGNKLNVELKYKSEIWESKTFYKNEF